MVYVAIFCITTLLATVTLLTPRHARTLGLIAAAVLTVFAGLRGASVDYDEYEILFELMERADDLDLLPRILIGKDPLFGGLMLAVIAGGFSSQMLFAIAATLSVGTKWLAFQRGFGQAAVPLMVTLYATYFLHDYTQIRAAIAVGLCFLSLLELIDRHPLRWILLGVVATGFHASASMFLLFSSTLLLPYRARWPFALVLITVVAAAARVTFDQLAEIDTRLAAKEIQSAGSTLLLTVAMVRVGLVALVYRHLADQAPPEQRPLLAACMVLSVVGCGLLLGLFGVAPELGFRFHQFLDSFSIFIIAAAFLHGSAPARVVAGLLCLGSLSDYLYAGLLVPYRLGTF